MLIDVSGSIDAIELVSFAMISFFVLIHFAFRHELFLVDYSIHIQVLFIPSWLFK